MAVHKRLLGLMVLGGRTFPIVVYSPAPAASDYSRAERIQGGPCAGAVLVANGRVVAAVERCSEVGLFDCSMRLAQQLLHLHLRPLGQTSSRGLRLLPEARYQ